MSNDQIIARPTARDYLALASDHDMHTAVEQQRAGGKIKIYCSCGLSISISNTKEAREALRNVPERSVA